MQSELVGTTKILEKNLGSSLNTILGLFEYLLDGVTIISWGSSQEI